MGEFERYAVYFAPRPGAFAERAAAWLGWNSTTGLPVPQPAIPGLSAPVADLTAEPRKYGFHGTIRAPFRPTDGIGKAEIESVVQDLAASLAPVSCPALAPAVLHGFVALLPQGDQAAFLQLGARVVERTNPLRAALSASEVARRRPERLRPRQRELLDTWGYPGVMEEFRFHLTLSGRLPPDQAGALCAVLSDHFAPVLPRPFVIEDLCLFGEDGDGRFHLLHRYPLSG